MAVCLSLLFSWIVSSRYYLIFFAVRNKICKRTLTRRGIEEEDNTEESLFIQAMEDVRKNIYHDNKQLQINQINLVHSFICLSI